jgi:hypothetical protein
VDLFRLLGYRGRWRLLSLLPHRRVSQTSPIVIGGCERSGTTLLRVLLGRHPKIGAGAGLVLVLPIAVGLAAMLAPALLREKRWYRTHSASRIWSAGWPAPRLAVQRRNS